MPTSKIKLKLYSSFENRSDFCDLFFQQRQELSIIIEGSYQKRMVFYLFDFNKSYQYKCKRTFRRLL
jgi:hypothetical protein